MEKRLVRFKGVGDGVKIVLDAAAPMHEILCELENTITGSRTFFGSGDCSVHFGGRVLTGGEQIRLEETVKKLLPLSRVIFEKPGVKDKHSAEWIQQYKERYKEPDNKPEKPQKQEIREMEAEKKDFSSILLSNRAKIYEGYIEAGRELQSDSHLVLFGRAEKGAKLLAAGNIYVFGGLYGSAYAGSRGHNGSYIYAYDMKPESLCIAGVNEEYTYEEEPLPESVEDIPEKHSIFDILKRKKEEPETVQPEPDYKEHSAVAMLKDNKIEFDDFSIKTFTNPKNML